MPRHFCAPAIGWAVRTITWCLLSVWQAPFPSCCVASAEKPRLYKAFPQSQPVFEHIAALGAWRRSRDDEQLEVVDDLTGVWKTKQHVDLREKGLPYFLYNKSPPNDTDNSAFWDAADGGQIYEFTYTTVKTTCTPKDSDSDLYCLPYNFTEVPAALASSNLKKCNAPPVAIKYLLIDCKKNRLQNCFRDAPVDPEEMLLGVT